MHVRDSGGSKQRQLVHRVRRNALLDPVPLVAMERPTAGRENGGPGDPFAARLTRVRRHTATVSTSPEILLWPPDLGPNRDFDSSQTYILSARPVVRRGRTRGWPSSGPNRTSSAVKDPPAGSGDFRSVARGCIRSPRLTPYCAGRDEGNSWRWSAL